MSDVLSHTNRRDERANQYRPKQDPDPSLTRVHCCRGGARVREEGPGGGRRGQGPLLWMGGTQTQGHPITEESSTQKQSRPNARGSTSQSTTSVSNSEDYKC